MKIFIFAILLINVFCYSETSNKIPYRGMMLSFSKKCLADDIFNITASSILHLKSFKLSDIKEEEDYGILKSGQYITNIKVSTLSIIKEKTINDFHYNEKTHAFSLLIKDPAINFQITFDWRIMALNVNIAYGTGSINARNKEFMITKILPGGNKTINGRIDANFEFSLKDIHGFGATDGIKRWILSRFGSNSSQEISKQISSNVSIDANLFAKYEKYSPIPNLYKFSYINVPMNSTEINGYIWISFHTNIAMNNVSKYSMTKDYYIDELFPKTELGIYLSPEHIIGTIELYKQYIKPILYIDTNELGYTGKAKDFFVAMPELALRVKPSSPIKIKCAIDNTTKIISLNTDINLLCDFIAKEEIFLSSKILLQIKFRPKHENKTNVYIAGIQNSVIKNLEITPNNTDISLFIFQMLIKWQTIKLIQMTVNIPGIMYFPLRRYYNYEVSESKDF